MVQGGSAIPSSKPLAKKNKLKKPQKKAPKAGRFIAPKKLSAVRNHTIQKKLTKKIGQKIEDIACSKARATGKMTLIGGSNANKKKTNVKNMIGDGWLKQYEKEVPESRKFWINRVAVWDAYILNDELKRIMGEQLRKMGVTMIGGEGSGDLKIGLKSMLLSLLLDIISVGSKADSFYGAQIQNLYYRNERKSISIMSNVKVQSFQKFIYLIFKHIFPWVIQYWSKSNSCRFSKRGILLATYVYDHYEGLRDLADLLAFVCFLFEGRYFNWSERISGMRLVYREKMGSDDASLTHLTDRYFNHSLMLESFSRVISAVLPLLRINRLIKTIHRLVKTSRDDLRFLAEKQSKIPSHECPICKSSLRVYRVTVLPCKHSFCYHCIETYTLEYFDGSSGIKGDYSDEVEPYPCPACETPISNRKMTFFQVTTPEE